MSRELTNSNLTSFFSKTHHIKCCSAYLEAAFNPKKSIKLLPTLSRSADPNSRNVWQLTLETLTGAICLCIDGICPCGRDSRGLLPLWQVCMLYLWRMSARSPTARLKMGKPGTRICGGKLPDYRIYRPFASRHDLCCETYNIHDSQDVLLDVPTPVVAHHHLVGHHESLDVTLAVHGALQGPLATADMMGRCLQGPLPPRRTLHGLLIWATQSHLTTFEELCMQLRAKKRITPSTFRFRLNWQTDHRRFVK